MCHSSNWALRITFHWIRARWTQSITCQFTPAQGRDLQQLSQLQHEGHFRFAKGWIQHNHWLPINRQINLFLKVKCVIHIIAFTPYLLLFLSWPYRLPNRALVRRPSRSFSLQSNIVRQLLQKESDRKVIWFHSAFFSSLDLKEVLYNVLKWKSLVMNSKIKCNFQIKFISDF